LDNQPPCARGENQEGQAAGSNDRLAEAEAEGDEAEIRSEGEPEGDVAPVQDPQFVSPSRLRDWSQAPRRRQGMAQVGPLAETAAKKGIVLQDDTRLIPLVDLEALLPLPLSFLLSDEFVEAPSRP
jgi:hypothetical protein